jgi:tetratricopeptide (TPR) repeat protein
MDGIPRDPMSPPSTSSLADPRAAAETLVGDEDERPADTLAGAFGEGGWEEHCEVLSRGAMLGRYIVLDRLGRGGMGIVYAAYDPELDRKVAVKLLLPGRDRMGPARLRLQREAQAIARLSHPNVVAVHDVGTVGGQVFVAMELVEGVDLARWLAAGPRSLGEIVELFLQAGAGLAAAHAAELVHRDFKPENVLVGVDGRARVVDFGLVRKDDAASMSSSDASGPSVSRSDAGADEGQRLTVAGALMGTPAYMSPEQFEGSAGDARSDQFSFCVALHEALYGERPFEGGSPAELVYAVTHGELRTPSTQRSVPWRLRQVLLRGLAVDPADRHPSMEALMVAIRRAAAPRRGRWWAVAGMAVLAGGGTWAFARHEQACAHAANRAAVVWSPERRAALQERFEATGLSYAADTWQRVQSQVDAHVAGWSAEQRELCEAGEGLAPAAETEDPRQRCLDDRLDELDVMLTVFAKAEVGTVMQAVALVHGLGAPGECSDVDGRTITPRPSDPVLREKVDALRSELEYARLAAFAGVEPMAPEALSRFVEDAKALGYAPLLAEIHAQQASFAADDGRYDEARDLLDLAFETALASRYDVLALDVATDLTFFHGVLRREPDEAHRWARRAEALHQRVAGNEKLRLQLLSNWASVYALAGDDARARALYDEALTIVRGLEEPHAIAMMLNNLGAFHATGGRLDEALAYLEESAADQTALLGPDHPGTLRTRANIGVVAVMGGRYAEARPLLEAVLPRQEAALGPHHPEVAVTLEALATVLVRADELAAAEGMRRRVLEIRERVQAPGSTPVLTARLNLANVLAALDRHAEARALTLEVQRALPSGEARLRTQAHEILALTALRLGLVEDARRNAEAGLATCLDTRTCHPH